MLKIQTKQRNLLLAFLIDYLREKQLPGLTAIRTEDLPDILLQFYSKGKWDVSWSEQAMSHRGERDLVKTTPVISEEDLKTISDYFHHDIYNNPNPKKIQQCLIFYIIYFFYQRGRENLYAMTWDTFKVDLHNGQCFVYQAIDEHDKNHGVDVTDPS